MNFPWVNMLWFCFLLVSPILTQYNKAFMRQFVFENLSFLMNHRYVKFQVFFNFLSTINLWNKGMFKKAIVQVNIPKQWGVTSLPGQYFGILKVIWDVRVSIQAILTNVKKEWNLIDRCYLSIVLSGVSIKKYSPVKWSKNHSWPVFCGKKRPRDSGFRINETNQRI